MENKEILFRGITASEPHRFVEGFVYQGIPETDLTYIMPKDIYNGYEADNENFTPKFTLRFDKYEEVIPETLGQFTGLLDKNGKKVFEGDEIIYNYGFDDDSQPRVSTVKRGDITSDWETCSGLVFESHHYSDSITEVIGTIHDHLLE